MLINTNNYSVAEIIEMLDRRELTVNESYQRASGIWPDSARSYFIDTILEKYPFPKIYMYEKLNRPDRRVTREIVDGQQRIDTIKKFRHNEFAIRGESKFKGMRFDDLDDDQKDSFLSYPVSVDVIRNASGAEILQMFRRMNAYTMPLNPAEKRHSSFQGAFKWFVNDTSDRMNEFFTEFRVFTERQIIRMGDAEFITDIIVAMERGIVSNTAKDLTNIYEKYDKEFPLSHEYGERLLSSVQFISSNLGELRDTFMMKTYALHSLITALLFAKYGVPVPISAMNIHSIDRFAVDEGTAVRNLVALARAHEAKEIGGQFARYVWGCEDSTTKAPRREARVLSILAAIGVKVQQAEYANLFPQS